MAAARIRRSNDRHPFLRGRPEGVWFADAVGVVPGYPKTQQSWTERQERCRARITAMHAAGNGPNRLGVPDGWAGDKGRIARAAIEASDRSKGIVKMAIENGILPKQDDPRVEKAFETAVEIIDARDEDTDKPLYTAKDRLAAGRLLADFLKSKPATKLDASISRPEDFLAILAKGPLQAR